MALLSFQYKREEFQAWYKLLEMFPEMNAQVLGFIGNEGKKIMKQRILSGQLLTYRSGGGGSRWRDKAGRPKVSYRLFGGYLQYKRNVKIASYPANFFSSKARKLRSGGTEARLKIYETLKMQIDAEAQNILDSFDAKYLKKKLSRFSKKPLSTTRY